MLNITKKNSLEIANNLPDNYKVLDVGGACAPFVRADCMIDIIPYENINFEQKRGEGEQRFSKSTYVQHDICAREPWPFKDKEFDYVFCSHVLEDIRDPIWVCSEMIRISKAGYIEIPNKLFETTFNLETRNLSGASHHRWVIDIFENKLRFTFKYFHIHIPFINRNKKRTPQSDDSMVLKITWEGEFEYFENWIDTGKGIFEFYLEREISDKEVWRIYRKVSPKNLVSRWLRYLKNTNRFAKVVYKKLYK